MRTTWNYAHIPIFTRFFNTQFNTQNLKDLKDLKPRAAQKKLGERKKKAQNPLKIKDFELLLAGSGRRIRTLTYGVRVRCATFTQSRYIANARVIIPNFRRMSSGIGKFSLNFFYFSARQSMETLSPVRRKNKTPSRTGFPSSRVSAAA